MTTLLPALCVAVGDVAVGEIIGDDEPLFRDRQGGAAYDLRRHIDRRHRRPSC